MCLSTQQQVSRASWPKSLVEWWSCYDRFGSLIVLLVYSRLVVPMSHTYRYVCYLLSRSSVFLMMYLSTYYSEVINSDLAVMDNGAGNLDYVLRLLFTMYSTNLSRTTTITRSKNKSHANGCKYIADPCSKPTDNREERTACE